MENEKLENGGELNVEELSRFVSQSDEFINRFLNCITFEDETQFG